MVQEEPISYAFKTWNKPCRNLKRFLSDFCGPLGSFSLSNNMQNILKFNRRIIISRFVPPKLTWEKENNLIPSYHDCARRYTYRNVLIDVRQ